MSKSPKYTGGPIVKTGPTSGRNRSRTQDGKWKRKRSDTGVDRTKNNLENKYKRKTASNFFWGTIIILLVISIGGNFKNLLKTSKTLIKNDELQEFSNFKEVPVENEIKLTRLEDIIKEAAKKASDELFLQLDKSMDKVYAPVYSAIPHYASFHYSVLGEYTELSAVLLEKSSSAIEQKLFSGFNQRFKEHILPLELIFIQEFNKNLRSSVQQEIIKLNPDLPLGKISKSILTDTSDRVKKFKTITSAVSLTVASGALKTLTQVLAKKIAAKVAVKVTSKGVVKGGGILAGIGVGTAACAPAGPFAPLCGIAGGVVAWIGTDAVIINIDEYFNREDFEKDLVLLINEDKKTRLNLIKNAIIKKTKEIEKLAEELPESFRLKDLTK